MSSEAALIRESVFKRYFLPGFVFQSVVIAGGYGTGRELAQFFLTRGPLGGLLSMVLVSTVIWSAVAAASFELARMYGTYDYRSFFQHLLGRAWFLYEICYFGLLLIILAVIAAAAGSILEDTFGLPYAFGVVTIMIAVGFLVFRGTAVIEKFFAGWSFVLYAVYLVLFVWCFIRFGPDIVAGFGAVGLDTDWIVGGIEYAAYNLALIPAILFTIRHAKTRREAVGAGLLTGPIAMFPALLFYVAMVGQYPEIMGEAIPANFLLDILGSRAFQLTFQIVLFGTLIETGTGMIHAVNERMATRFRERGMELPPYARPVIALTLLVIGALVSSFGLINLIAKGYGTLTWLFLIVFVVPVLTLGIWKIRRGSGVGVRQETQA
ncbi:MAG: hypothetical protein IIB90_07480 [Gemmatimonadetes bacterium]|nr:hypothetical protein [Gemmatimonadota bacterium]